MSDGIEPSNAWCFGGFKVPLPAVLVKLHFAGFGDFVDWFGFWYAPNGGAIFARMASDGAGSGGRLGGIDVRRRSLMIYIRIGTMADIIRSLVVVRGAGA